MWGEQHYVLLEVWDPQTLFIIQAVVGDPGSSVEEASPLQDRLGPIAGL